MPGGPDPACSTSRIGWKRDGQHAHQRGHGRGSGMPTSTDANSRGATAVPTRAIVVHIERKLRAARKRAFHDRDRRNHGWRRQSGLAQAIDRAGDDRTKRQSCRCASVAPGHSASVPARWFRPRLPCLAGRCTRSELVAIVNAHLSPGPAAQSGEGLEMPRCWTVPASFWKFSARRASTQRRRVAGRTRASGTIRKAVWSALGPILSASAVASASWAAPAKVSVGSRPAAYSASASCQA